MKQSNIAGGNKRPKSRDPAAANREDPMSANGKRMLIKEILQGLQESSVAHPEMTEDDRTRSLQMQSFLKHLEIQMDDEGADEMGGGLLGYPGAC